MAGRAKGTKAKKWPTWVWYAVGGGGALVLLLIVYLRNRAAQSTATTTAPVLIAGSSTPVTTAGTASSASTTTGADNQMAALAAQNAVLTELLQGAIAGATQAPAQAPVPAQATAPPPAGKAISYREAYAGTPGLIRVTEFTSSGGTRTYTQRANTLFTLLHTPTGSAAVAEANDITPAHLAHLQSLAREATRGNTRALNRLHSLGYLGGR
jgi:hypothetical protein